MGLTISNLGQTFGLLEGVYHWFHLVGTSILGFPKFMKKVSVLTSLSCFFLGNVEVFAHGFSQLSCRCAVLSSERNTCGVDQKTLQKLMSRGSAKK